MPPKRPNGHVDTTIALIAKRQHGVITILQLLAAGLSRSAVRDRVRAGRLHRIHRGVYAVGHAALSNEGTWMGTVLACGAGAVLSHRSAAELWGMLKPLGGPPHVSVPGDGGRKRAGIAIHRPSSLLPSQTTVRAHIPVTRPARTLADLKRSASANDFKRALREAEFLGLPVADVVSDGTDNDFEAAFLGLCRRHRLPMPLVKARVGLYEVDFLWPDAKLIVETDGWQSHRGKVAFETDRERDLRHREAGAV